MAEGQGRKIIALNRKARHDYFVEETYEAGIELFGTEVKSVRQGAVNLKDSYCMFEAAKFLSPACGFLLTKRGIFTIKTL